MLWIRKTVIRNDKERSVTIVLRVFNTRFVMIAAVKVPSGHRM